MAMGSFTIIVQYNETEIEIEGLEGSTWCIFDIDTDTIAFHEPTKLLNLLPEKEKS